MVISTEQRIREKNEIEAIKARLRDNSYCIIVSFSLHTQSGDLFSLQAISVTDWPELRAREIGELKAYRELLYQARKVWAQKNGKDFSEKKLREIVKL